MIRMASDAYIILGHGIEDTVDFNARDTIPENIILVTLAECGLTTGTNVVFPMIDAFTKEENKHMLNNPIIYKHEIETILNGSGIHIYAPGQSYPKLKIQQYIDWNRHTHVEIMKSGLYKFPLKRSTFEIADGTTFYDKLIKTITKYKTGFQKEDLSSDYSAKTMYEDSIMPRLNEVEEIIKDKKNVQNLKDKLTVSLEDIFKKGGAGIYYYVVCRSPSDIMTPEQYVAYRDFSNDETRYKPYYNSDWVSHIPEIIPLLQNDLNKEEKISYSWSKDEIKKLIHQYKTLQKVPLIRRKSINQQATRKLTNKNINAYLEKWKNYTGGKYRSGKTRKNRRSKKSRYLIR